MKIYLVGGAVRDISLGRIPKDNDFVVVGSSVEEMLDLGFTQVGKDFPVFLHPVTSEEYALARQERSTGIEHDKFICRTDNVSLEEDLLRRDLTINSMAIPVEVDESGEFKVVGDVIDPYGGLGDIKTRTLRATGKHFSEDPLRVLRVGRFLSQLTEDGQPWSVSEELSSIISQIVECGDLESLPSERIWKELERSLEFKYCYLFLEFMKDKMGLFQMIQSLEQTPQRLDHHPEGDVWTHTKLILDYAHSHEFTKEQKFACLTHDWGKPECHLLYGNAHGHEKVGIDYIDIFCQMLKVPNRYRKLALDVCEYHTKIHGILGRGGQGKSKASTIMKLFEDVGAIKNPDYFHNILECCSADARGRGRGWAQILEFSRKPYPQTRYLMMCLHNIINLDTSELVEKLKSRGVDGRTIGLEIRAARISKIRGVQKEWS